MVWTYLDVYYGSAEEVAVEFVRVGNLALSLGNIQCCCIPIHRTFSLSSSLPFAPPFLVLYAHYELPSFIDLGHLFWLLS